MWQGQGADGDGPSVRAGDRRKVDLTGVGRSRGTSAVPRFSSARTPHDALRSRPTASPARADGRFGPRLVYIARKDEDGWVPQAANDTRVTNIDDGVRSTPLVIGSERRVEHVAMNDVRCAQGKARGTRGGIERIAGEVDLAPGKNAAPADRRGTPLRYAEGWRGKPTF